jgi:hypothetical protein
MLDFEVNGWWHLPLASLCCGPALSTTPPPQPIPHRPHLLPSTVPFPAGLIPSLHLLPPPSDHPLRPYLSHSHPSIVHFSIKQAPPLLFPQSHSSVSNERLGPVLRICTPLLFLLLFLLMFFLMFLLMFLLMFFFFCFFFCFFFLFFFYQRLFAHVDK